MYIPLISMNRAPIFKLLWSPGIDSKEWISPAYVAWWTGTITLCLAPKDCLKNPAQYVEIEFFQRMPFGKVSDLSSNFHCMPIA
jgi:hypothetical protein